MKEIHKEVSIMPTIEIDSRFAPKLESKLNELIYYADYLNISEIWLFGSVARGTCNAFSDIDLLVLTSSNSKEVSFKIEELELREEIGFPKVDIIVRTPESISNPDYYFNTAVQKDKIVLWKRGDT